MFKGSNRKMFRKPGMARRAIGILASSPEIMQAANRNMPVRMAPGGLMDRDLFQQAQERARYMLSRPGVSYNMTEDEMVQGLYQSMLRQKQAAGMNRTDQLRATARNFVNRIPITPTDTQPFELNRDLGDRLPINEMGSEQLETLRLSLLEEQKALRDRPGGKRKDPLTRLSVDEELKQVLEAQANLASDTQRDADLMSKISQNFMPDGGIKNVSDVDVEFKPSSVSEDEDGDIVARSMKGTIRGANISRELQDIGAMFKGLLPDGDGDDGSAKTNPIERLFSPKTTNRAEQLVARKERTLLQALSSGKGIKNARAEYDRALKGLEDARAGVEAYDEGTKILETRRRDQIQNVLDNYEDLPADLRTKLEAELQKIPDPNQAVDRDDADRDDADRDDTNRRDNTNRRDGDGDGTSGDGTSGDGTSGSLLDEFTKLLGDGMNIGLGDGSAVKAAKEALADMGEPPELAEQPDFWNYVTRAGLAIAAGKSDDPLANIAEGVLMTFNQKAKDDKEFRDAKFMRYLKTREQKAKDLDILLTAENVDSLKASRVFDSLSKAINAEAQRDAFKKDRETIESLQDQGYGNFSGELASLTGADRYLQKQKIQEILATQAINAGDKPIGRAFRPTADSDFYIGVQDKKGNISVRKAKPEEYRMTINPQT